MAAGVWLDNGSGRVSVLLLFAALLYGAIGWFSRSGLVWWFALLSLGNAFGAETGYLSGWGAYWLGMSYPIRFIAFGAVLIAAALLLRPLLAQRGLQRVSLAMGLLYLFIALWLLSIFGNYGDLDSWYSARQIELFHWSLLFGLAALAAIWLGLKHDDAMLRGFGLTFLGINLYTRLFEFFWDSIPKAVFFVLLGLSLWALGHYAEDLAAGAQAARRDRRLIALQIDKAERAESSALGFIPAAAAHPACLPASGAHKRTAADYPACCRCNRCTASAAHRAAAPAVPLSALPGSAGSRPSRRAA